MNEMSKKLEFMECAACAAKTGSPVLCEACLTNRRIINELQELSLTKTEKQTIISLCKEKINELQIPARRNQPEADREVLLMRIGNLSTIIGKLK